MPTKSISIQPHNSFFPTRQKIENLDTAFHLAIGFAILLTIGILICAGIPKGWQHSLRFNSYNKIPCRRCRYFSDNHFLKCTLHPTTTLTEEAVDCRDYCPHSAEKQAKLQ